MDNFGAPISEYSDPSVVFSFYLNLQCDDVEACNYAPGTEGDQDCSFPDPGYDCDGTCLADEDGDGVCDDFEVFGCTDSETHATSCLRPRKRTVHAPHWTAAACSDLGEIYECGCADIPQGDCDCDGNQLDAVAVCGEICEEDVDNDGICDDVDDCVGALDDCGICNGQGHL